MAKKRPIVVSSSTSGATSAKPATASKARQALVTTGVLLAFVILMTMIAGIGPNAGRLSAALMIALIVLQALGHVNPFVTWAASHPLTPGDQTFTAKGLG